MGDRTGVRAGKIVVPLLIGIAWSSPSTAQAPNVVRLSTSAAETYAQPFYAQHLGLFRDIGVPVDVQTLATGAAAGAAVLDGSADIGVATIVNLADAKAKGVPIVIMAPATLSTPAAPTAVLCVAKSSPYTVAADFAGKTIAVPALRQTADLGARAWLDKGGLDPAKVRIVEAPFSAMLSALASGTYAGAMISEPALTTAMNSGGVRCFPEAFQAIAPTFMLAAWFTTQSYATAHPDLVARVASALTEAGEWANAHQPDSAAIVAAVNKTSADAVRAEVRPRYGETISPGLVQPQLDAGYKFGFLTRPVTAAELLGK